MNRIKKLLLLLGVTVLLLTGCNVQTVSEMYCLPKRSEEYNNLQAEIDKAMDGLEYSAPLTGEHQQTVQMADLTGDGNNEYILFAKGNAEKPLQILIFSNAEGEVSLLDTIECSGTAFDQVEYVAMDGRAGLELIVGRQVSDQVLRSVTVYSVSGGQVEQKMTANYSKFLCSDLDRNGRCELMVFCPDEGDAAGGVAEIYTIAGGNVERSAEIPMSGSADRIKRIMTGKLQDGVAAVYVASEVEGNAIVTDIFAMVDGTFTNVTLFNESGTRVETLRNYYVYADDIDDDGVLELPSLINMKTMEATESEGRYLIRWYSLKSDGGVEVKKCTYHNFVGGWYMELNSGYAEHYVVTQLGSSYEFSMWDMDGTQLQRLMTVYALTGQKREEQALTNNRFVLHRNESTIYAASLEVASAAYEMTQESIISSFHLIVQDWDNGMT